MRDDADPVSHHSNEGREMHSPALKCCFDAYTLGNLATCSAQIKIQFVLKHGLKLAWLASMRQCGWLPINM